MAFTAINSCSPATELKFTGNLISTTTVEETVLLFSGAN